MENIILRKKRLDELPLLHEKSVGSHADVVVYKDGLIKRFNGDIEEIELDRINKNINRSSEVFMYPKCLVYDRILFFINIRGYFMDKAKGIDLITFRNKIISGSMDFNIDEFLTIYYDRLLPALKREEMMMWDMKPCQVFIGENFSFVDTDPFLSSKEKEGQDILKLSDLKTPYEWNLKQTNLCIKNGIEMIFDYLVQSDLEYTDENYIHDYFNRLNKITNKEAKTFKEAERYLSRH